MKLKTKISAILFSLFSLFSYSQTEDSFIVIKGTSNISNFKCINDDFHQLIPLSLQDSPKNKFAETSINLIVKDFNCKNKAMTSDFRKTLHADKFPFLNVTFLKLEKVSDNNYKGYVRVKMMQKVKKYYIDFTLVDSKLVGNKTLRFTDFDITPPKRFGGLLYVKDIIDLSFSLKIKE